MEGRYTKLASSVKNDLSITKQLMNVSNGNHKDESICVISGDSVEDQVMAGVVTWVSTVNSFNNISFKIPVSNSNRNWLHYITSC